MDIESLAERCMVAESCLPDAQYRTHLCKLHQEMLSEIARLQAELESARADAERYRHLKDIGVFRVLSLDMSGKHTWTLVGRPIRGEGSTIDAAIDAARGGE